MVNINAVLLAAASSFSSPSGGIGDRGLETRAACPTTITCPGSNGCTYAAANGNNFLVTCSVDFYGGDLSITQASTFAMCMTSCTYTSGCVGVSYVGTICYMKQALKGSISNGAVTAASISGTPVANPTTSSWAACVTSTSDQWCQSKGNTANVGCNYGTLGSKPVIIRCGRDFYGNDLALVSTPMTLTNCMYKCYATSGCVAVSWVPPSAISTAITTGNCYMKSSLTAGVYSGNVIGVTLQ